MSIIFKLIVIIAVGQFLPLFLLFFDGNISRERMRQWRWNFAMGGPVVMLGSLVSAMLSSTLSFGMFCLLATLSGLLYAAASIAAFLSFGFIHPKRRQK